MLSKELIFQCGKTVEALCCAERVSEERHFLSTCDVVNVLHVGDVIILPKCVETEVPILLTVIFEVEVRLTVGVASCVGEPDIEAFLVELKGDGQLHGGHAWNCVVRCESRLGYHVRCIASHSVLDDDRWLSSLSHGLSTLASNVEESENESITRGCVVYIPVVPIDSSCRIELLVWAVVELVFAAHRVRAHCAWSILTESLTREQGQSRRDRK